MRIVSGFILLLLFKISVNAQILGYLPLYEDYPIAINRVIDFSHAKNKNFGIGNYGFNTIDGFFNPKFNNDDSRIFVKFSSMVTKSYRDFVVENNSNIITKNEHYFCPNFGLTYKYNSDISLQINYKTDLYLSQTFNEPIGFRFPTAIGEQLYTFYPSYYVKNNVFQLSGSYKLNKKSSITFGALTNNFKYELSDLDKINFNFYSSFFKNFQIIGSFNYENNLMAFYLFMKSQNSLLSLSKSIQGISNDVIWLEQGIISFPGIISYGFQYKISKIIDVSFEGIHEYLFYNKKRIENRIYDQNIFNTEFVLGFHSQIIQNFQIGVLFSYYLHYDTKLDLITIEQYGIKDKIKRENPIMFNIAIRYIISMFELDLSYQYSYSEYDLKLLYKDKLKDTAHFINFGVTFKY